MLHRLGLGSMKSSKSSNRLHWLHANWCQMFIACCFCCLFCCLFCFFLYVFGGNPIFTAEGHTFWGLYLHETYIGQLIIKKTVERYKVSGNPSFREKRAFRNRWHIFSFLCRPQRAILLWQQHLPPVQFWCWDRCYCATALGHFSRISSMQNPFSLTAHQKWIQVVHLVPQQLFTAWIALLQKCKVLFRLIAELI